jgi:hypothetical protein
VPQRLGLSGHLSRQELFEPAWASGGQIGRAFLHGSLLSRRVAVS